MSPTQKKEMGSLLRYVLNFWTIILFVFIVYDFLEVNALEHILGPLSAIYAGLLAIYSAEKEFERWHFIHLRRHPGEVYVIMWTVLIVGLFIGEFVYKPGYTLEPEIISTYIVVLGILAITKKSKSVFLEHNRPKV